MAVALVSFTWPPVKSAAITVPVEAPVIDHEAELRAHIENIAASIYEAEGRCHNFFGKSGEVGCYQYQAGTWRAYSMRSAGKILPQTRANEDLVTEGMIRIWLEEGRTERWIFLTWNQGNGDGWGPGTKDCYSGVNKWGVHYDSCAYAAKALAYLAELEKEPLPQAAGEI